MIPEVVKHYDYEDFVATVKKPGKVPDGWICIASSAESTAFYGEAYGIRVEVNSHFQASVSVRAQ